MLILGILFLLLGIFIILNQRYTIKSTGRERNIERKTMKSKDILDRYRTLLSIFSIIVGVYCIINYIIY